jgi:hypothetical protein
MNATELRKVSIDSQLLPIPAISAIASYTLGKVLKMALCMITRVFASTTIVGLPETRLAIFTCLGTLTSPHPSAQKFIKQKSAMQTSADALTHPLIDHPWVPRNDNLPEGEGAFHLEVAPQQHQCDIYSSHTTAHN